MASKYTRLAKKLTYLVASKKMWNFPIVAQIFLFIFKYKHIKPIYLLILFVQGLNERFELKLFENMLKPGMNVIDIGANMGLYTFKASQKILPEGKVFSFEPEINTFKLLMSNIRRKHLYNVSYHQLAVSDKVGKEKLYFDEANVGGHSFTKENLYRGETYLEVQTTTLDDFFGDLGLLDKIDIIKIDTQGSEGLVINGGKKLLEKSRPIVMLEFWPNGMGLGQMTPAGLLKIFTDLGYSLQVIDKLHRKTYQATAEEIINMCSGSLHVNDYVDLLLTPKI